MGILAATIVLALIVFGIIKILRIILKRPHYEVNVNSQVFKGDIKESDIKLDK